jgi:Domain of unknown function (DUF5668)
MKFDRRLIGFGLFFIAFGTVLLGVRQGWISTAVAQRAWQLWPILLIGIGLSVLLARRPGGSLGGLVVAVCLGGMAGGLVGGGTALSLVSCGGSSGAAFAPQSGQLGANAAVDITFNCGDLVIGSNAGSAWSLSGASDGGGSPVLVATADRLSIDPADRSGVFGFAGAQEAWDISLPTDPMLDLDVTLNAGRGKANLGAAHIGSVGFTVNAGSLQLDLGGAERLDAVDGRLNAGSAVVRLPNRAAHGSITVNAGSLTFCAPEGLGLRFVTGNDFLSSNDFGEHGLVKVGDAWESPNFATAELRLELTVKANAGSLSLNSLPACAG